MRSAHVSRNFPTTDSYSLVAELSGPDAALQDSAWVSFVDRTPVPLSRTSATLWATVFSASYFSDPHLQSEIGLPFVFHSLDNSGVTHQTGPVYLFRVIEDVPARLNPIRRTPSAPARLLAWESFSPGFHPFYYRPAVYVSAEDFVFTVWVSDDLPESQLSITVPDSLADGQYYWTVTVVDTFDNTSRSKEGIFTVASPL